MLPVETCAAAGDGVNPTMVRASTASIAYIRLGRVLVIDISTRGKCFGANQRGRIPAGRFGGPTLCFPGPGIGSWGP